MPVPTLEPGIHYNIQASIYHQLPYISSSFLKKFRVNPAAALIPTEPTDDMNLGSAIHAYSLEGPEAFAAEFAVMFESDLNKNTNAYKGLKAEFEAANIGKTILPAQFKGVPTRDIICGVDASLKNHPLASQFLRSGNQEVTLIWDDPETGARCKARLDWHPGKSVLVDLKKTASVGKFARQIVDLCYDVQGGHYANGSDACGLKPDTFIFVAVEAAPPYPVKCGFLNPDWLKWAQAEASRLISLVQECRKVGFPNFQIPSHICSLNQLTPTDLLEEFVMPAWR